MFSTMFLFSELYLSMHVLLFNIFCVFLWLFICIFEVDSRLHTITGNSLFAFVAKLIMWWFFVVAIYVVIGRKKCESENVNFPSTMWVLCTTQLEILWYVNLFNLGISFSQWTIYYILIYTLWENEICCNTCSMFHEPNSTMGYNPCHNIDLESCTIPNSNC